MNKLQVTCSYDSKGVRRPGISYQIVLVLLCVLVMGIASMTTDLKLDCPYDQSLCANTAGDFDSVIYGHCAFVRICLRLIRGTNPSIKSL